MASSPKKEVKSDVPAEPATPGRQALASAPKTPKTSKKKPAASPKPGAKGHAKPKAKPKVKPSIEKKKEEKATPKSKPKSVPKKESFSDKVQKWKMEEDKKDAEDSEDACEDSKDATTTADKRDLAKTRKYKRMADANAIPQHISEMMDAAKTRAEKTAIINQLFDKDSKGKLLMRAEKPVFKSGATATNEKFGKDQTVGKPWDVFLWESFGGNNEALQSAVANGSVQSWTQDGVKFAGYRTTKAGIEKSVSNVHQMESGETEVSQDTYKALNKAFSSMAWSFADEEEGEAPGPLPAQGSKVKAVEHAGLTSSMKALLDEAKGAQERLHATAMKLLGKCSAADDKAKFKACVLELKDWVTKNEHILTWEELPDESALTPTNFKEYMSKQADATVKLNERVEQFKALLRSRKEL